MLLAGLAQTVSLSTPWNGQPLWWLQLLTLALLAGCVRRCHDWLHALVLGWAFAIAWLTSTFWWLYTSMHTYGGLAAVLAALAVLALAGFLGSYYAVACALFRNLMPRRAGFQVLLFAALWLLAELARAVWFTGFPWGAIGYAHVDGPLAALAPWVGVWGINFIAAALAMTVVQVFRRGGLRQRLSPLLASALMLGLPLTLIGLNQSASHSTGRTTLTLLQGNIPQEEKFQLNTGVATSLKWYADQLMASDGALVVAPETAIPLLPSDLAVDYLPGLVQRFSQGHQAALVGIPLGDGNAGYTNSVVGLQPQTAQQGDGLGYRYAKHHLVPFGEFIPPMFRWFTDLMNIPLGDFNRGALGQPSFAWDGQRFAPNVCYEDLFGEELGTRFADPASAPTVFINVSNLGWFGDGQAIDQHLQISRLRTLEFARPMVRATNTGATAVIDHQAHVLAQLPRSTRAVLRAEVEGRDGITPYAWWVARAGLWPCWALGLGGLGLALVGRLRRMNQRARPAQAR